MNNQSSIATKLDATSSAHIAPRGPSSSLVTPSGIRNVGLSVDRVWGVPGEHSGGHPTPALNARYWLRQRLAAESPGEVFQAHDIKFNRPCAVKLLGSRWEGAKDATDIADAIDPVQRLLHEAEVLSRLSHPNIVALYECSRDENGCPFLVMEPLEGRDLRSLLDQTPLLPPERVLAIVRAVGAALQHAHAVGIVHLDLNPSNIFLCTECSRGAPEVEVVKLMNFGLAKQLTPASASQELQLHQSRVFSPPTYHAPEALELRSESVDPRADQWSLAVLAYQLLSGRLPFWDRDVWRLRELIRGAAEPVPLEHLLPDLPAYLLDAIHRALSKRRDQRYATIADFMRALDGLTAYASNRTRSELGTDRIDDCHQERRGPTAPISAPLCEKATQKYPALSFPVELLASQDDVPVVVLDPQSCSLPEPPGPSRTTLWRRPGSVRRLGLACCLGLSMASVSVVAAREYLHFLPPPLPPISMSPLPAAPPPQVIVTPPRPEPPPATQPPQPPAHSSRHRHRMARLHPTQPRASMVADLMCPVPPPLLDKTNHQQAQARLAEGLGL